MSGTYTRRCPRCEGDGRLCRCGEPMCMYNVAKVKCPTCGGTGRIVCKKPTRAKKRKVRK